MSDGNVTVLVHQSADNVLLDAPEPSLRGLALEAEAAACFHCGQPCPDDRFCRNDRVFCCQGCLAVHELLAESGLDHFYELDEHPGVRIKGRHGAERWAFLNEPSVQQRLLDFTDGHISRVTFQLPAIHCVACVWLLENLFRMQKGLLRSQVNFPKREAAFVFDSTLISLGALAALLASLGYEPRLTLGALEKRQADPARKRRWLQMGISGFAFGNIMLLSVPGYLGLDTFSAPFFKKLFGGVSLVLAVPVVFYCASDYWRALWLSVKRRSLTLDVPIALGLAALYARSAFEILSGRGTGYLDSLAGLVFFVLCGRAFQHRTYERLAFDRDYRCFFPLCAIRKTEAGEESVALSQVKVGERLLVRHGELVPADATLLSDSAWLDYSFVSGESEPVLKGRGDYLYAGGRHTGSSIEVQTLKPVSQSYLTSLWDHEAFRKGPDTDLYTLTNCYSRRFTRIVVAVAVAAAIFWFIGGDSPKAIKAFISVLIVACPCALALAAPFTLGTAQRVLARLSIFVRNVSVLERMAEVDTIVFDKTGTLTAAGLLRFVAAPAANTKISPPNPQAREQALTAMEELWVYSLTRHSTHPHSMCIASSLAGRHSSKPVRAFREIAGCGIEGEIEGHDVRLGSGEWLERGGTPIPRLEQPCGSITCVAIDGVYRGAFVLGNAPRPATRQLIRHLGERYELALLSGDNEKERERFRHFFGSDARLQFNQSPLQKLEFISGLQKQGRKVMMVGDGLNDAGALKQSEVGVAVIENVGAFSPASDVILEAGQVPNLFELLSFARSAARIVRVSFAISACYNVVGVAIAAAGLLSPLVCAVLMPLSSLSVVLFACGATTWAARQRDLLRGQPLSPKPRLAHPN